MYGHLAGNLFLLGKFLCLQALWNWVLNLNLRLYIAQPWHPLPIELWFVSLVVLNSKRFSTSQSVSEPGRKGGFKSSDIQYHEIQTKPVVGFLWIFISVTLDDGSRKGQSFEATCLPLPIITVCHFWQSVSSNFPSFTVPHLVCLLHTPPAIMLWSHPGGYQSLLGVKGCIHTKEKGEKGCEFKDTIEPVDKNLQCTGGRSIHHSDKKQSFEEFYFLTKNKLHFGNPIN